MPSNTTLLLLLVFIFAFCLSENGVYAFGAGNIPSFAYLEGKAFRHGDIEDVLAELIKRGSGGGFALASMLSKGSKFNGLDVKRVYFGNWLRDYSQAVDVAGLKKLQLQTIVNLCMVLGFMAHGYATHEFEVTEERLGVYLPTEHIDNPKGYGDGEDARKYHPKLRGPVDPVELEIDPRTGMKNYIANENGHWDTSKALVRRTLEKCIHLGRQQRSQGRKQDEYEAYRLLGQALHTLEDFSAHSNFCELALFAMGHSEVFLHVGDQVRIQSPNGRWVAPLVTGTFGSADFAHSLLGEATDHLSEASVSDLNKELDKARSISMSQATRGGPGSPSTSPGDTLREIFFSLPGGEGSDMSRDLEGIERIRAGGAQGGKRPEDLSPQELHAVLWQILTFRDSIVKKISKTIEKIPGLGPLIEKLNDSIAVFVLTTLEPYLKPLLKSATTGLQSASGEVIDTHDQYEVFNDPRASDPTHSFLSKDHFNLILNEPAGHIAKIILIYAVNLVTKAWDDTSMNVHTVTEDILQCLFHPDFHDPNSKIQREMMQYMRNWVQQLGGKQYNTIHRLSKNAVRNHENIRLAADGSVPATQGSFAYNQGIQASSALQGYVQQIPGVAQAQSLLGGGAGKRREGPMSDPAAIASGYPGASHGHAQITEYHSSGGGQAASYYSETVQSSTQSYSTGPPAFPGGPSYTSSYAPPPGPPPPSSFPGAATQHQPPQHTGYAPSYAPAYSSPPPSFPNSGPSFPGGPEPGGFGSGFAPPPGPPPGGFPSAGGHVGPYSPPPGPPPGAPGFPSADSYGSPPQFPSGPGSGGSYPYGGNQGGAW